MSNHIYRYASAATLSLAVAGILCVGTPVRAQSAAQTDNRSFQNDDSRRGQLTQFDRFLDSHPEIAEQLRRNPSLADDRTFVQNHPALQSFLQNNPDIRNGLRQDPNVFMRQEDRFDRREDAVNRDGARRGDGADFGRFLDNHREIAEQVRRNPSLMDNREFVQNHPALQAYLQNNPGVRDQVRQDPNAFMRDENRFDRPEDGRVRDSSRDHMANFGEFLGGHEGIKQDVSKDPNLVKNREYVENHRDLNEYLNAHPEVKQDWTAHPQEFVKGAQQQQFNNGVSTPGGTGAGTTQPTETKPTGGKNPSGSTTGTANPNPTPAHDPSKPKQ